MHKAYTRKRVGIGTWIQVQRRGGTCTKLTHRNMQVQTRGNTFGGLKVRERGLHDENCRYEHVDTRPGRNYRPKKVDRGMCIHVQRSVGTCTKHVDTRPKEERHGTWTHVEMRNRTCTKLTHQKVPVQARAQTLRGLKVREQGLHNEKDRYR